MADPQDMSGSCTEAEKIVQEADWKTGSALLVFCSTNSAESVRGRQGWCREPMGGKSSSAQKKKKRKVKDEKRKKDYLDRQICNPNLLVARLPTIRR